MRKNFYIILPAIFICAFIISNVIWKANSQTKGTVKSNSLATLFTLADAQKILGEPAKLADSNTSHSRNLLMYKCSYKTNAEDAKTKKTGNVYFLIEEYSHDSLAHNKYTFIKKANEDHGIKTLDNLGDEAYFHSDNQNFYFLMARKGARVFNMKVNKLTSYTSLQEFNAISRKIVDAM